MTKKWKLQELGSGLLLMIAGLILLLMPELALVTIANVVGGIVIIIGVVFIVSYLLRKQVAAGNYDLVKGVIILAVGLFICVQAETVVSILPVILGIGVVISGIVKLQHGFDLRRMGYATWTRVAVTGLISAFIGLIVIMNPFSTVAWLVRFIGAGLIYSGVTDMMTTAYVSKKTEEYYVDGKAEEQ